MLTTRHNSCLNVFTKPYSALKLTFRRLSSNIKNTPVLINILLEIVLILFRDYFKEHFVMVFSSNCAGYCECFQMLQMTRCRKKTQRIRKHLLQQQNISLNTIQNDFL